MNISYIINKKKQRESLTKKEIQYAIDGITTGRLPDYQVSALLMAIWFNGMDEDEIFELTMVMMRSGEVLDLSSIGNLTIDKHSTGGIGDKITLIAAPLWKEAGLSVAKMSGRGLGFTGGTIDKLESIPKIRVQLDHKEFLAQVKEHGIAITGQSGNLVPADKKLYALRDVTETIDSLPLIASSVMSKKLATGSDILVLDVKYGRGAFMKTYAAAKDLAYAMVKIGQRVGRKVAAVLSPMDQPLGYCIGNSLEILESLEIMAGKGHPALENEVIVIGGTGLYLSGKSPDLKSGIQAAKELLDNGSVKKGFREFVQCQGGEVPNGDFEKVLPLAKNRMELKAKTDGYVQDIDAMEMGMLSMELGAGRKELGDAIDHGAGVRLHVKVGDEVKVGDVIATLYSNESTVKMDGCASQYGQGIVIGDSLPVFDHRFDLIYGEQVIRLKTYLN